MQPAAHLREEPVYSLEAGLIVKQREPILRIVVDVGEVFSNQSLLLLDSPSEKIVARNRTI